MLHKFHTNMRPWALLSLLGVSAAWDTSVVHVCCFGLNVTLASPLWCFCLTPPAFDSTSFQKGLFTQPFKPRDRNAAYAIDIVPYTDAVSPL